MNTQEAIKVMQDSLADDVIVERRTFGDGDTAASWEEAPAGTSVNCTWNWRVYRYRVMPKAREYWLAGHNVFNSASHAGVYANGYPIIHVKEVL